ncbi:MAG: DUF4013 domain-containing protein [Planctomycetia bacterium]|nr:DUF4013 domain-containing protein [Planctomycetia bacterium]
MSYSDPAGAYSSPSAYPASSAPDGKPAGGMDYMRMFMYIFQNPNWMMTVLFLAVCRMIPVIGALITAGYQFEVVIGQLNTGGARYPDFDWGKFVDYLMRGLWPFLVGLVCSLVLSPLFLLFICSGLAGEDAGPAIAGFAGLLLMVAVPVLVVIMQPMLLRAAFACDFAQGFQIDWVKDFLKRMWLEQILGLLFLMLGSLVLTPLGLLACCVGILAVQPILALAFANLMFQLYTLYLLRGGTPIPIKLSAAAPTPARPGGMPPGYPPNP